MSTDFPTAPLASRFINQRAAAPWKSLSLRLTHRNPDTPQTPLHPPVHAVAMPKKISCDMSFLSKGGCRTKDDCSFVAAD